MTIKKKISKMDIATTLIIVLGPMFTQYSSISSVILLPELVVFPLLIIYFLKYRFMTILNLKKYSLYFFLAVLLTLLNAVIGTELDLLISSTAVIRHLFYYLVIITIGYKNFDSDFAAKVLIITALFNSIYGFVQYAAYSFTRTILPWHISFLPLRYGIYLVENSIYFFNEFGFRFSGLFSEPAHFSQYISIALLVLLFYRSESFKISKAKKFIGSAVFILSLLLNGSGTGFATSVFIMLLFFFNSEKNTYHNLLMKITFVFLGVIFLSYIVTNETFNIGLDRILSVSELSTGNIRIFRPFHVFSALPGLNKIIGVGYANYSEYVLNSSLATQYELSINIAWTNTIGYVLVGSGILGLFIYIRFFVHLFTRTKHFCRYLVILTVFFSFFTEVPLSFQFITILSFIINDSLIKKENS